jgi:hypothetical protein
MLLQSLLAATSKNIYVETISPTTPASITELSISISNDGTTAVVGSPHSDTDGFSNNGRAYIFIKSGSTWVQQQVLVPQDPATNMYFGIRTAISANGNTVLISTFTSTNVGTAYAFVRNGTTWSEQKKFVPNSPTNVVGFGYSVALSGDGNTALIGSYGDNIYASNGGGAYIFTRSGSTWTQQVNLAQFISLTSNIRFGFRVSLSGDGNIAVVNGIASSSGDATVRIFSKNQGDPWTTATVASITKPSISSFSITGFGSDSRISFDGSTIAITAPYTTINSVSQTGAAFIYTKPTTSWTLSSYLYASDRESFDRIGSTVRISADGSRVFVATVDDDNYSGFINSGAVYFYYRPASGWVVSQLETKKERSPETPTINGYYFGQSLGLSGNGKNLLIGSVNQTDQTKVKLHIYQI